MPISMLQQSCEEVRTRMLLNQGRSHNMTMERHVVTFLRAELAFQFPPINFHGRWKADAPSETPPPA
jgi:hypothetical protein